VRTFKSVWIVIGALMPIAYCGTLLYYFLDISGSMRGARTIGLGPTVLGLAVVALLFCIPLILKLRRIIARPGSGSGPDGSTREDETGFDADAAIARYMAQRSVEAAPATPARTFGALAYKGGGPAKRTGFGRRTR